MDTREGPSYRIVECGECGERQAIQCRHCGLLSFNENDIRERYCGRCHRFHDEAERASR